MLSAGVTQMLDRVRAEFGVDLDVLDAELASTLVSESRGASPVVAVPEFRQQASGALREGRSRDVLVAGRAYRLIPIRGGRAMSPSALLSLAMPAHASGRPRNLEALEPWLEAVRGAIASDLTRGEELDAERHQARTIRGALQFVSYLASARTERAIAEAVIQAAAVWFDADARVYRRDTAGGYALFAALPGAAVAPGTAFAEEGTRLEGLTIDGSMSLVRVGTLPDVRGLSGVRDGILVPVSGHDGVEWLVVVLGLVPTDAEPTLEVLGRVLGAQMERLALRRETVWRSRFEGLVARAERPVELTALEVLRDLVVVTEGAGAALWVQHGTELRRIAAVGAGVAHVEPPLGEETQSSSTRFVRSLRLGRDMRARLELSAPADVMFGPDVCGMVESCAAVMRAWLPSAARPADDTPLIPVVTVADFVRRIEEELARARRFDRRLALVLVEASHLPASSSSLYPVMDVIRRELRGSDVLGLMGQQRVVALLIETDTSGVGTVVRRLRQRLSHAMPDLRVPTLTLGQAAFSPECMTADALLSQAATNAEAITRSA